jgi:N-acetylglucosamine malate deacetylase 1
MTLDILAICPHPDDAELHCAGLLLQARAGGARIGVLDLSRGELGSRGDATGRAREAQAATQVMGLAYRENLGLPDGFLQSDRATVERLIAAIRALRPRLVLAPHWEDHHPDHAATSRAVREAAFLSGLTKYPTQGEAHRPEQVMYYLDRVSVEPDVVVDVSEVMALKEAAVRCYAGQLHAPDSGGVETLLSRPDFIQRWRARHLYFGELIGVDCGEAYVLRSPVAIRDPMALCWGRRGMV